MMLAKGVGIRASQTPLALATIGSAYMLVGVFFALLAKHRLRKSVV